MLFTIFVEQVRKVNESHRIEALISCNNQTLYVNNNKYSVCLRYFILNDRLCSFPTVCLCLYVSVSLSTIYLHRTFKERAPKAVKAIRAFATKAMNTPDVRLDVKLNKAVWAKVCVRMRNMYREKFTFSSSSLFSSQDTCFKQIHVMSVSYCLACFYFHLYDFHTVLFPSILNHLTCVS